MSIRDWESDRRIAGLLYLSNVRHLGKKLCARLLEVTKTALQCDREGSLSVAEMVYNQTISTGGTASINPAS
jgi:hypothetical protein